MMATPRELALRQALTTREALEAVIKDSAAPHIALAATLENYRKACHSAILENFDNPACVEVEEQLWVAHGLVNNRFRSRIDKIRRDAKHRVVEIRKLAKQYLDFIKSSQRFYRDYVLQLDQRFGGIEEIQRIAKTWKQQEAISPNGTASLPPQIRRKAILSCYRTLIHLGDLSRYRAAKIDDPEKKNWGPAVGYYSLAGEICPESGISHNQRAMIAVETGNHLGTIYHFYRALSVDKPHPLAKDNLEKEFKRIISAWEKGELIKTGSKDGSGGAGSALIAWFVRLHSKCYKGTEFAIHTELENEVLGQLTRELKDRALETTLLKMILINVAAEDFASVKLQGDPTEAFYKSYSSFLRLNTRTFLTLLRLLHSELQQDSTNDSESDVNDASDLGNKITAVTRRILPGLRLYSSWFTKNWAILASDVADNSLSTHIQELWQCYAETLTMLASVFPAELFPSVDYMLEEDVETIGFKPLFSKLTQWVWSAGESLRPKFSDSMVERSHPNDEMLVRIRDILVNGLELAARTKDAPLSLDGMRFVHAVRDSADEPKATSELPSQVVPNVVSSDNSTKTAQKNIPLDHRSTTIETRAPTESRMLPAAPTNAVAPALLAEDLAMNRMVDDLVGADDGIGQFPNDNMPPTPPEQTFDDTELVNEITYGLPSLSLANPASMGQIFTPKSTAENPQYAQYPSRPSMSSPSLHQLSSIPLLSSQSGIWGFGSEIASNPASPYLQTRATTLESPSNPYGPSHGHSRQHSGHSSRGSADPWNTSFIGMSISELEHSAGQGLQSRLQFQSYGGYGPVPAQDYNAPAAPFYGSPWHSDVGSSLRRTPPNGQSG